MSDPRNRPHGQLIDDRTENDHDPGWEEPTIDGDDWLLQLTTG